MLLNLRVLLLLLSSELIHQTICNSLHQSNFPPQKKSSEDVIAICSFIMQFFNIPIQFMQLLFNRVEFTTLIVSFLDLVLFRRILYQLLDFQLWLWVFLVWRNVVVWIGGFFRLMLEIDQLVGKYLLRRIDTYLTFVCWYWREILISVARRSDSVPALIEDCFESWKQHFFGYCWHHLDQYQHLSLIPTVIFMIVLFLDRWWPPLSICLFPLSSLLNFLFLFPKQLLIDLTRRHFFRIIIAPLFLLAIQCKILLFQVMHLQGLDEAFFVELLIQQLQDE